MREEELKLRDNHGLFYRVWDVPDPVATVHINHGMAEHGARYERFALFLNSRGFAVYAQDHRGHGRSASNDETGWFSEKEGWKIVTDDAWEVDEKISKDYPGIPHFLFGHSMGSFITRCEIEEHDAWMAAVICGTGAGMGILGEIGIFLSVIRSNIKGSKHRDEFLNNVAFSSYNKKFEGESPYRWLSRSPEEVKKYEEDPLCGFVCSSSFYGDLIRGIKKANSRNEIGKIRKDLPILIISGTDDPVGAYGKGVMKVASLYEKSGLSNVRTVLVPGGRHEILNEIDCEINMGIIADFYTEILRNNNDR